MTTASADRGSVEETVEPPALGWLYLACLALAALVMLRSAWVSDDALITFRTLDQFTSGNGLRWNLVERVQTYTHPLWLLVLPTQTWSPRSRQG